VSAEDWYSPLPACQTLVVCPSEPPEPPCSDALDYTVQEGNTCESIAADHCVDLHNVRQINGNTCCTRGLRASDKVHICPPKKAPSCTNSHQGRCSDISDQIKHVRWQACNSSVLRIELCPATYTCHEPVLLPIGVSIHFKGHAGLTTLDGASASQLVNNTGNGFPYQGNGSEEYIFEDMVFKNGYSPIAGIKQ
jgi:hypothetical protein